MLKFSSWDWVPVSVILVEIEAVLNVTKSYTHIQKSLNKATKDAKQWHIGTKVQNLASI